MFFWKIKNQSFLVSIGFIGLRELPNPPDSILDLSQITQRNEKCRFFALILRMSCLFRIFLCKGLFLTVFPVFMEKLQSKKTFWLHRGTKNLLIHFRPFPATNYAIKLKKTKCKKCRNMRQNIVKMRFLLQEKFFFIFFLFIWVN